ncbi:MAG: hypothetical protein HYV07_06490 [Deltaproteobacteria bacterium]|nr:hypothetical protein [Deltaproteobacteria bacterium]
MPDDALAFAVVRIDSLGGVASAELFRGQPAVALTNERVVIAGYSERSFADTGIAADRVPARSMLRRMVGCGPTLPKPTSLSDPEVELPSLTASWLDEVCPPFSPERWLALAQAGECIGCAFEASASGPCTLTLAPGGRCPFSAVVAHLNPDGSACVRADEHECSTDPLAQGGVFACGGDRSCTLGLFDAPVVTASRVGVTSPVLSPADVRSQLMWSQLNGALTGSVRVGDDFVVSGPGLLKCAEAGTRGFLTRVSPTAGTVATATISGCPLALGLAAPGGSSVLVARRHVDGFGVTAIDASTLRILIDPPAVVDDGNQLYPLELLLLPEGPVLFGVEQATGDPSPARFFKISPTLELSPITVDYSSSIRINPAEASIRFPRVHGGVIVALEDSDDFVVDLRLDGSELVLERDLPLPFISNAAEFEPLALGDQRFVALVGNPSGVVEGDTERVAVLYDDAQVSGIAPFEDRVGLAVLVGSDMSTRAAVIHPRGPFILAAGQLPVRGPVRNPMSGHDGVWWLAPYDGGLLHMSLSP